MSEGRLRCIEPHLEKRKTYELLTGEHTRPRVWFSAPSLKTRFCHVGQHTHDAGQPCREGATWNTRGRVCSPPEMEIFREVGQDEQVIDRIAAAEREDGSAALF